MDTSPFYDNLDFGATNSAAMGTFAFTGSIRSLFLSPLDGNHVEFPDNITASTMFLNFSLSMSGVAISSAYTTSVNVGIYIPSGRSLSLINSVQKVFSASTTNSSNTTNYAGVRFLPIESSLWSSEPAFYAGSRYYVGWFVNTSGVMAQTGNILGFGRYSSGQRSGSIGQSQTAVSSMGYAPFYGIYTATTSALPATIANSQLNKTAATAGFTPHVIMVADENYSRF
jgi:hypothetical protein